MPYACTLPVVLCSPPIQGTSTSTRYSSTSTSTRLEFSVFVLCSNGSTREYCTRTIPYCGLKIIDTKKRSFAPLAVYKNSKHSELCSSRMKKNQYKEDM
jgi:hypothetical protein